MSRRGLVLAAAALLALAAASPAVAQAASGTTGAAGLPFPFVDLNVRQAQGNQEDR